MSKKITYKTIASKLDAYETTEITLDGELFEGMTLTVKDRLTLLEMSALIMDVVNTVIDMEKGEYNPEFTNLIKLMLQLKHYAGFPIGKNDLAYAYRVIYETNLYEQVMEHVDAWQVDQAMDMADERIQYMKEMIIATAGSKTMELLGKMEKLMQNVSSAADEVNGADVQTMMTSLAALAGNLGMAPEEDVLAAG